MDDRVLSEIVKKKRSGSAARKGSSDRSKSKDVDVDDDNELVYMKQKVAASKSEADKYVKKICAPGGSVRNLNAEVGAGSKSAKTRIEDEYSVAKKGKSSARIKISGGENISKPKTILENNEENIKTPVKRKRGADGEISQYYLSSAERSLSRFRPRKVVPAFRMVDLVESDSYRIVGKRLKVYWPESRRWFTGHIQAFERRKKRHMIRYDDGDTEELDLRKERFELEIIPSEGFTLRPEPKSLKKAAALDGYEASEEGPVKVGGTKNIKNCSETQKRNATKKIAKKGYSELKMQGAEIHEEQSISVMDGDMHPKTVDEALIDGLLVSNGPGDAISGKERGVSKIVELHDNAGNSGKSGNTIKDESSKKGNTKPSTKHADKIKDVALNPAKRRTKLLNRKVSQSGEKLDSRMEGKVDVEDGKQNATNKNDALVKKKLGDSGVDLLEAQATTSCPDAENVISLGYETCGGDADNKVDKQKKIELASKDAVNVAKNMDVVVLTAGKVKEKVGGRVINVEMPKNIPAGENDNEMGSHSKAVSEGSSKVPPDLQQMKKPEEGSLEILQVIPDAKKSGNCFTYSRRFSRKQRKQDSDKNNDNAGSQKNISAIEDSIAQTL